MARIANPDASNAGCWRQSTWIHLKKIVICDSILLIDWDELTSDAYL